MFARRIVLEVVSPDGTRRPAPLRAIDSFAMRNFTNDACFDDTLPVADGLLEAGHRVPLDRLHDALSSWMRKKSYLTADETLSVVEQDAPRSASGGLLGSATARNDL